MWIRLFQLLFHLFPLLPTKRAAVSPSSGPLATCESMQVTRETRVSGPWRQSEKSDDIAKVDPKRARLRHTKAHGNMSWALTAQKWKLILSRGCVVNTYSRSHGTAPKAVPTCEGTAFTTVWQHLFIADLISPGTWLFMPGRDALFNGATKAKRRIFYNLLIGYQTLSPQNNQVQFSII